MCWSSLLLTAPGGEEHGDSISIFILADAVVGGRIQIKVFLIMSLNHLLKQHVPLFIQFDTSGIYITFSYFYAC